MNVFYFCFLLGISSILSIGIVESLSLIRKSTPKPSTENALNDIFRLEGCILAVNEV